MTDVCGHLDQIHDVTPSGAGCVECLAAGRHDWVHLRVCQECGHVGCCDNSPGKHATAHFKTVGHPIIRSYEPGEDWYYCYIDDLHVRARGRAAGAVAPVGKVRRHRSTASARFCVHRAIRGAEAWWRACGARVLAPTSSELRRIDTGYARMPG